MTLVDAIIAVSRTSAGWEKFRQELIDRYGSYSTFSDDHLIGQIYLSSLLMDADGSEEGWREYFIWCFAEEARSGRCRVSGIIRLRRKEIPADLFEPGRFVDKLVTATTSELENNELILPDGTAVVAIEVEFPNQTESVTPPAEEARPRKRPGRKPVKRNRVAERMLSEIKSQKTTLDSLLAMGWDELGAHYKTSPQTADRAKRELIKTLENS